MPTKLKVNARGDVRSAPSIKRPRELTLRGRRAIARVSGSMKLAFKRGLDVTQEVHELDVISRRVEDRIDAAHDEAA